MRLLRITTLALNSALVGGVQGMNLSAAPWPVTLGPIWDTLTFIAKGRGRQLLISPFIRH